MKKCCLVFVLFLSAGIAFSQSVDVVHYAFHIDLNDANDTVRGKAAITVKFDGPASSLRLDLALQNEKGAGMRIDSLTGPHVRGFLKQKDSIRVMFTTPLQDTATFLVYYHGVPSDGLIISKNKYGHRTFFADNWPNRGHKWLPCVDDPGDKASVEFIVTAPDHYQVVSNGIQVEESNLPDQRKVSHWREDVPIATKVMVIGVAEFAVNLSAIIDCVPIYSWVYPEDRDKGFYDYSLAGRILSYYNKTFGPYGYKKLANVQSKTTFGGLENANTIFYSENSVTGTGRAESLLAHEIAHQWFGNMAGEKSFAHLWLSEGFATYLTILYMESRYGADTAIHMLKQDREQVIDFAAASNKPVVDTDHNFMRLLNANSYQKGGWVLHMLRKQLGDSLFYKSIRAYYATYAGGNADTRDLERIIEKTSGRNLQAFFNQWLYTPGIPQVAVGWSYSAQTRKITVTVRQQQKTPFEFPLELGIRGASGKEAFKTVLLNQAVQTFSLPLSEKPLTVIADPHTWLLADLTVTPN